MDDPRSRFPMYLPKGEVVEFEGKLYVMPEAVAFNSEKELAIYIFNTRLRSEGSRENDLMRGGGLTDEVGNQASETDVGRVRFAAVLRALASGRVKVRVRCRVSSFFH